MISLPIAIRKIQPPVTQRALIHNVITPSTFICHFFPMKFRISLDSLLQLVPTTQSLIHNKEILHNEHVVFKIAILSMISLFNKYSSTSTLIPYCQRFLTDLKFLVQLYYLTQDHSNDYSEWSLIVANIDKAMDKN